MPAEFKRVKEIFLLALEQVDPHQREAYLRQACGGDPDLRRQVEVLLQRRGEVDSNFLEQPAFEGEAPQVPHPAQTDVTECLPPQEAAGTRLGPYKLLQSIGQGGMGAVWMAQQQEPVRRLVALKVMRVGLDSAQAAARFEAERQALALMDHPNIAKVLDGGTTADGRPYFVMELVKGTPITRYCDEHRLTLRQRLELFIPVCQALQHAHQKGIIHRDVKPSNVLVAPYDGTPVVKVIDFGVAKATGSPLTERTLYTEFGTVVGTLEYMSPEQAELNNQDIDTRSDVYSLGVLLYELLTGTTPLTADRLKKSALLELLRAIREEEPPRPSTRLTDSKESLPSISAQRQTEPAKLRQLLRSELDWIVMKALEKDRNRRYETANSFAQDVQRYLAGEPVQAVPPSATYRLRKFARKHRVALTTATMIALLLVAGVAVSTWQAVRAMQAEGEAQQAARQALEAQQAEAVRADGEKKAKEKAQAAAAAEQKALAQAQKRLAQLEKGNEILGSIFADLDIRKVKAGEEPLEAVLARRLVKAAAQLEGESVGEPEAVAAMQDRLGTSLLSLGFAPEAIPLLEKARATRQAKLGPDHPDTLLSMNNLALGYQAAKQLDKALPLFEETLRLSKARLGPDHPDTVSSMGNLATAYQAADRMDKALPLLEKTLELRKAQLGPDHPATLGSMNNLGEGYRAAGRLDKALPLFEEALRLSRATQGSDHLHTLGVMNNLADAYRADGQLNKALPLSEEALKLSRAKLGPDHPVTLICMGNLGMCYRAARALDKALPLLEETLRLSRARLGPDHPDTLIGMNNLGLCYRSARQPDKALPLFEEALRLGKARLGPDHPDTLAFMANLAKTHLEGKHPEKALPVFDEYVPAMRARLGKASPGFASVLAQISLDLLQVRQFVAAETYLKETLAIREKVRPDAWTTFNTQSMLGGALLGQKKYADAEPLLLAGYEGMQKRQAQIPPQGKARLTEALQRLVQLYDAWGKADEAAKWRKALAPSKPIDKK
jgi:serine/threonine protein kinase/tetratricopeptide (TPR) repeat protein